MKKLNLALATAMALALSAPANAVTFVSIGLAGACYDYARENRNSAEGLDQCSAALTAQRLSDRDRAATHVNRGIIHLRRGSYDMAMSDFDRAISVDPALAEGYINRGAALLRQQNYRGAVEAISQGLERSPEDPAQAYYNRAVANEELGNVRAAYNDYRRAAELRPTWDAPQFELSRFQVR